CRGEGGLVFLWARRRLQGTNAVQPRGGGQKNQKIPRPAARATWASGAVTDGGIVFATRGEAIELYNPTSRKLTRLAMLDGPIFWLGASPDARKLVFDKASLNQSQIVLVENFR